MFDKVLTTNDFTTQVDGVNVATIPATAHGMAGTIFVERFMKAVGNGQYENATLSYDFDTSTGDVKIYVDEAGAYKVTLNQIAD